MSLHRNRQRVNCWCHSISSLHLSPGEGHKVQSGVVVEGRGGGGVQQIAFLWSTGSWAKWEASFCDGYLLSNKDRANTNTRGLICASDIPTCRVPISCNTDAPNFPWLHVGTLANQTWQTTAEDAELHRLIGTPFFTVVIKKLSGLSRHFRNWHCRRCMPSHSDSR